MPLGFPKTATPAQMRTRLLIGANLSLLILFPIAWFAPLLRAGLLPLFKLKEISVISGINSLLEKDIFLAIIVILFALVAPMLKVLGTTALQLNRAPARLIPALQIMGKFAMADIFLIAMYIVVAKGVGVGRLEVGWGLYLFTACVLTSLVISLMLDKKS
ncbi:paraquat-inducible protein A [Amylibacter marinus]|uniref:Paraquat-inducible protein A n=1 Tax=Amylibacter marinus TaxID=1475483 RepID=A0ABQ5VS09_9RHOB|nr:paraquat-inducible protein A [Amylibacter marinus]GLQ33898.1 paraquat-inducible protein A [Amylibacter marinus]